MGLAWQSETRWTENNSAAFKALEPEVQKLKSQDLTEALKAFRDQGYKADKKNRASDRALILDQFLKAKKAKPQGGNATEDETPGDIEESKKLKEAERERVEKEKERVRKEERERVRKERRDAEDAEDAEEEERRKGRRERKKKAAKKQQDDDNERRRREIEDENDKRKDQERKDKERKDKAKTKAKGKAKARDSGDPSSSEPEEFASESESDPDDGDWDFGASASQPQWKFTRPVGVSRHYGGWARWRLRDYALVRYGIKSCCMFRWEEMGEGLGLVLPRGWEKHNLINPRIKWDKEQFLGWVGMAMHNPEPGTDFTHAATACLDPDLANRRQVALHSKMRAANKVGKVAMYNVDGHGVAIVQEYSGAKREYAVYPFGKVRTKEKANGGQQFIFERYRKDLRKFLIRYPVTPGVMPTKYRRTIGMIARAEAGKFNEEQGMTRIKMERLSPPGEGRIDVDEEEEEEEEEGEMENDRVKTQKLIFDMKEELRQLRLEKEAIIPPEGDKSEPGGKGEGSGGGKEAGPGKSTPPQGSGSGPGDVERPITISPGVSDSQGPWSEDDTESGDDNAGDENAGAGDEMSL